MKKAPWYRFLKKKRYIALIIVILLIGAIAWARSGSKKPSFEYATAELSDVIQTVSVTGTVSPMNRADLAFKKGGVVAMIYAKAGDAVKKGQPIASLDSAADQAALAAAQASLADASRGLRPEELAVQESSLSSAEKDAALAAQTAYASAQSALFSYADAFYSSPQSPNPKLSIPTDSIYTKIRLENERLSMTTLFALWKDQLSVATATPDALIASAIADVSAVRSFMNDLAGAVAALPNTASGLSAQALSSYTSTMNSGIAAISSALSAATAAQTALQSARSAYVLKIAGNSSQSIAAYAAKVQGAQADLAADTIVAPFDGVVTKADPQVGEYISPGQSGFAVQDGGYKIEAFVPEADIAKVAVNDLASSTLDAYGSDTDFPARVVAIDPAETVIEGVPTYKVTLQFVDPDERIRSGMTANLEIRTAERHGVLAIPYRAVTDDNGSKTVRLVSSDGLTYADAPVTTGLKGSDGLIEITGGIAAGDKVVTYVK